MKDKDDDEKPRWDLLPLEALEGAVRVMTLGAKKYTDDGWKTVPDARRRYYAALLRHLKAWQSGELVDPEDGESHLDHALCCLVIVSWHDQRLRRLPPPEF